MDSNDGQSQDERNIKNNANNINNAADVAIASKVPVAAAIGGGVKIADKVTGGKSSELLGKAVNQATKVAPGGAALQNASNKLSESGASNAIGKGASLSSGGSSGDVPSALKNPNPEGSNYGNSYGNNSSNNSNSSSNGLGKKDGLDKKDENDTNKKGGDKSGKDSSSSSASGSSSSGGSLEEKKQSIAKLRIKAKIIIAAFGILFAIAMFLMIFMALSSIWDSFVTSITSFFGIREGKSISSDDYDEDETGGLWTEEKYFINEEDGEDIGMTDYTYPGEEGHVAKGIVTILNEDNYCNKGTLISWFNNLLTEWTGNFNGNPCRLLNYIWGSTDGYEKKYAKYGLNIDESLIIATIFYGYDEQPEYNAYEDPENEKFVSASEHYSLLLNILEGGDDAKLKKEDVDRIVRSAIFEEVWPYWRFKKVPKLDALNNKNYTVQTKLSDFNFSKGTKTDEKIQAIVQALRQEFYAMVGTYSFSLETILSFNGYTPTSFAKKILNGGTNIVIKAPVMVGQCVYKEHVFYYGSKEKWELFIRFNDGNETTINDFGVAGYTGSYGKLGITPKAILDRTTSNYNLSTLYGSGWVYETNMNNSWINSSEPCNGTMSESEILSKYGVDKVEKNEENKIVSVANNFYKNRGVTSSASMFPYTQKINEEELYTVTKDKMVSSDRKYTDESIKNGGSVKTTTFTFEYKYGYAYVEFPGFKQANDDKLESFIYDDISTPKQIEVIVLSMLKRKDEFDEILQSDIEPNPYEPGASLDVNTYCQKTQEDGVGKFEVLISDCEGKYMTTRSFKEYILGVTLGEIGYVSDSSLDEYVKTQMVASISYTLGRRSNYQHSNVFEMKSGSCDQNWCDIYLGCSRSEEGGFKRDDGSVLKATYPGVVENSVTKATCSIDGITATGYYMCPLSTEGVTRYSKLFDDAFRYVVASSSGGDFGAEIINEAGNISTSDTASTGFNGAYTASTQGTWKSKALAGELVQDILAETYTSSSIYDCVQVAEVEERSSYDWPHVNEYGNTVVPSEELCVNYNDAYDATWNNKVVEVAYRLARTTVGDCSSFVRKVIRIASSELGMSTVGTMSTSTGMFKYYGRCNCADPSSLHIGDIIFERTNPDRWMQVGHVGIFMGYNDQGQQLIFESNTRNSNKATGSYDKPALVVNPRGSAKLAGYSRWYPTAISESECKSNYN